MNNAPKCRCGRSPTGNCMGWHALSEEEYLEKKKAVYESRKIKNENYMLKNYGLVAKISLGFAFDNLWQYLRFIFMEFEENIYVYMVSSNGFLH